MRSIVCPCNGWLVASISQAVNTVNKASRYALPITIVNSPADIGVTVPGGEHPPGAFHNGRIYLFSDNLTSTSDVYFTLFHELFHLGLTLQWTFERSEVNPVDKDSSLFARGSMGAPKTPTPPTPFELLSIDLNPPKAEELPHTCRSVPGPENQGPLSIDDPDFLVSFLLPPSLYHMRPFCPWWCTMSRIDSAVARKIGVYCWA
jgi:hypothetical protein